jgi:hypothetical protein
MLLLLLVQGSILLLLLVLMQRCAKPILLGTHLLLLLQVHGSILLLLLQGSAKPILLGANLLLLLLRSGRRGQRPVLCRAVAGFKQHQQRHVVFEVVVAVAHLPHHCGAQQRMSPEGGAAVTPSAVALQVDPRVPADSSDQHSR